MSSSGLRIALFQGVDAGSIPAMGSFALVVHRQNVTLPLSKGGFDSYLAHFFAILLFTCKYFAKNKIQLEVLW